jgi:hypothetical protein
MTHHSRQTFALSRRQLAVGFAALALLVGAISLSAPHGEQPVDSTSALSVQQECQAALGYAARTNADIQWLNACVNALTPPMPAATGGPTPAPSGSPAPPTTSPVPTPSTASPTPSPSSTQAVTGAGCLAQPSSCGYPDATNTGVPAGTTLTPKSGDMQITQAGTVIDGIDLTGCITIWAPNVTIKRSKIRCDGPYGIFSYARNYSGGGLQITDVEVDCMGTPTTGIASYGFTATRVNVHGCVNGFAIDSGDVVQDSYVHDLYTANASTDHSDGLQIPGGSTTVRHNTIINSSPGGTSAIIMAQTGVSNLTIDNNLLSGGGFTLYCPRQSGTNVQVTNNRFGTFGYGASIGCSVGADLAVWANNVYDSNGKPVPTS